MRKKGWKRKPSKPGCIFLALSLRLLCYDTPGNDTMGFNTYLSDGNTDYK